MEEVTHTVTMVLDLPEIEAARIRAELDKRPPRTVRGVVLRAGNAHVMAYIRHFGELPDPEELGHA